MAYAFVQSVEGSRVTSGTTISVAYTTANVTAGNLLIAVVGLSNGTGISSVGQVSDNQGNYWKQVVEFQDCLNLQGGPDGCAIWCCESAGGGNKPTVTATLNKFPSSSISGGGMNMLLLEYSGNSGHELIDQIGQKKTITTTVTVTTNFNLVGAGDLALSAVTGNMSAATVPSSWTSRLADATQHLWVAEFVGPSSGSPASAAWTALTGSTMGAAIIVCFKTTGTTTGPTLLQSTYLNGPYPAAQMTSWTSQAFPVNPVAGHTLVTLVSGITASPFNSIPVLTCVGSVAADKWVKVGESGPDPTSGVNLSWWVCSPTLGGSNYTITVTFPFGSANLACSLYEFSGFNYPMVVDSSGTINSNHVNQSWVVSTGANVGAGDLALAGLASLPVVDNHPASGWTQMLSDTAGVGWACYQTSTAAGSLTSTWSSSAGQPIAGSDMVLVALRGAPGAGAH